MLLQLARNAKLWREISIPVPWGEVRGKWWGPTNIKPILTLHGWQDNCGSFDRLIPLLLPSSNLSFLAVDLPGHGYSSRLPSGLCYNLSTYLIMLKYVSNYLQLPKVSLMGHSMGGLVCYTYAMMFPQSVDCLACIDGLILFNSLDYMAKAVQDFPKNNEFAFDQSEPPCYTLDEIKQKIHEPHNGSVDLDNAEVIMHRNVAPSQIFDGKWYFSRDPRLKCVGLYTFSLEEYKKHSGNIVCPVFLSKFTKRLFANEMFEELSAILPKLEAHVVPGTHHGHLNNPETHAILLTKFFNRFKLNENRLMNNVINDDIFVK